MSCIDIIVFIQNYLQLNNFFCLTQFSTPLNQTNWKCTSFCVLADEINVL